MVGTFKILALHITVQTLVDLSREEVPNLMFVCRDFGYRVPTPIVKLLGTSTRTKDEERSFSKRYLTPSVKDK